MVWPPEDDRGRAERIGQRRRAADQRLGRAHRLVVDKELNRSGWRGPGDGTGNRDGQRERGGVDRTELTGGGDASWW